ncbi:GlxA family transcriptional regulator [Nocardia aurantia]|uniref:HTH-type transcriptional regulator CdhR n=1 Tax=Nocardia aurantia TaxID=2585199 RepID=A0A7K0DRS2_9NOCA|nr:helix-turn-helix domain-containing protein [Nocardia aurantia]MQY28449.1 HTH-type transcriptional regulator CdhR [Nocardia aurantia]
MGSAAHKISVVAVPPVTVFDLSVPETVFSAATVGGEPGYEVSFCTARPGIVPAHGKLPVVIENGLDSISEADTVIVTGTGARHDSDPQVLAALSAAAAAGKRIASICTGAFVLAQAGLLDDQPATTYWLYSQEMRERFPAVDLQPEVLFVDNGQILTSAGLAAGIDLCLHIVRHDYGSAVANAAARLTVVAPIRPGGQAQFIEYPLPPPTGITLAPTRVWATQHLDEPLTLRNLAAHAHVSERTLTRRFRAETGSSPLQWLLRQRIDRARELLETSDLPIEEVARRSGLGGAESLRQHLFRRIGLTPTAYRASFTRRRALPSR